MGLLGVFSQWSVAEGFQRSWREAADADADADATAADAQEQLMLQHKIRSG